MFEQRNEKDFLQCSPRVKDSHSLAIEMRDTLTKNMVSRESPVEGLSMARLTD